MPDTEITITLQYDRPIFKKITQSLRDKTPLAKAIGEKMVSQIDQRFEDEVDPDGSPWAALQPSYVRWKIRNNFSPKRLQMTGDLKKDIDYTPYSDRVEISTDLPYARRQHEKRPFLHAVSGRMGEKDIRAIEAVAEEYLRELVERVR